MFGRMVLPDAAALFMEDDLSRPMEFMLHIPMLAHHRDTGGGRARQTGNGDAVVARDRGMLLGPPHRCYSNHGLPPRPLRQCRKGGEGGDDPDAPPYGPAVRGITGSKAVLGRAPGQVGFAGRMQGRLDCRLGLGVIALQGQERGAPWVPAVLRAGWLTA